MKLCVLLACGHSGLPCITSSVWLALGLPCSFVSCFSLLFCDRNKRGRVWSSQPPGTAGPTEVTWFVAIMRPSARGLAPWTSSKLSLSSANVE